MGYKMILMLLYPLLLFNVRKPYTTSQLQLRSNNQLERIPSPLKSFTFSFTDTFQNPTPIHSKCPSCSAPPPPAQQRGSSPA